MTRTERMQPVVQHTDKKEQRALQQVAQSQGELELEQSRFSQLKQYKYEYLQKKQDDVRLYSALEMQEFNRFLDQLEQTINRQEEVILQRQQELEQKRRRWQSTRIDAKVMRKAVEKLQRQETIEQERKEQKELDDITQITIRRRQS